MNETTPRIETATIRPGDLVRIGNFSAWFRVARADAPALLELESPTGATLKTGRASVSEIQRPPR